MEKRKKKAPEKPDEAVKVKLEYVIPDVLPTYFVTNAVIQRVEDEFVIGFYNVRRPILLTDEDRATVKELKTVKATCSAQISVSPERLEKFVKIFQEQLNRYASSLEEKRAGFMKQFQELSPKDQIPDKTKKK